jgi:hypothetical protein
MSGHTAGGDAPGYVAVVGTTVFLLNGPLSAQLSTQDLTQGVTVEDLVNSLVGPGVTITNIQFSGADTAAGKISMAACSTATAIASVSILQRRRATVKLKTAEP